MCAPAGRFHDEDDDEPFHWAPDVDGATRSGFVHLRSRCQLTQARRLGNVATHSTLLIRTCAALVV